MLEIGSLVDGKYKILNKVYQCAYKAKLHKVQGVGNWSFCVAVYEIAHKICNDYIKARNEKDAA